SYALGAAVAVSTSEALNGVWQHSTTTANTHAWYDGAVLDHLSYNKAGVVSTTDYVLNGSGQLLSATISDSRPRTITYTNDMAGQIIRRDEADTNSSAGDPHEIWYRFDGRQLGMVGNNGTLETDYTRSIANRTQINGTGAFRFGGVGMAHQAEFGPNLQPITSYSQGGAGGSHIVRAGDSLSSIAAGLWGDAALWYKLAEANGLGGDTALAEGQVLLVPSGVLRSSHNASTFRPYDAADALGETSPVNPTPKARKNNKCGAFGAILLTVVAVAVTAIVAPWATGIAVNAGLGAVGGAIAGGAVAGVAASVASQGVGLATGIQDKFSWKGVALSALSGAVGGGLSHAKALAGGGFIGGFTRGAIGSAVSQGVGVVTGLQSKFDFAGVAAAGLGSGAAAGIGIATERWGSFGSSLAANTASGIANAAVRTLANGGSFGDNLIRALPDVIGSTVGNALAGAVARSSGVGGGKGGKAHAGMAAMEAGGPTTAPVAANEDAIVITGGANNPAMTDEEYDAGVAARNAEVDAREAQEDARLAAAATAGNQAPNDPLASLNLRYVTPLTIEQNHQTTRELVAHITSLRISDAKRDILLTAAYNRQADWDQRIAAATAAEAASIRAIFGNTSLLASGGSQNSWFSPAGNSQSPRLSSSSAPWGLSTSNGVVGSFILPALQHGLPTSSVGSNLWPYMQIGQTPFYGNQYVRTLQLAPIAEFAGRLSFGLGFALDINSYRQGQISGGKFALNTFMGVVGMRGGPWGAAAAAIYFGVDAFYEGGWSGLASDWQSFNARVEADRLRYNYGPRY
ncbi:LysM peptidoglycan-binding domain-containing protein, partial [Sphingosinicella sp.]|uniref:LysM peptidoglycan-binding domain-containing protein n=1 Tax=Sphingosinicella sp. TaxID=1917971 RepID=UPI00403809E1